MAHSAVGICNQALANLGADSIRDFDDDNKRARMCEIMYNAYRPFLLSMFDWPFARGFAKLQKVVTDEDLPEGKALYALPSGCLGARDVHPRETHPNWEVIGSNIMIDEQETVYIYYTKNITNTALFSEPFVMTLTALLTWKLCQPIKQDVKATKDFREEYAYILAEAQQVEANSGSEYRQADETPDNDTFVNPDVILGGSTSGDPAA